MTLDLSPQLTVATAPASLGGGVRPSLQAGIVHIGLGNFHRAHQAVYTSAAMAGHGGDWGIIGVANRSPRVVDAMRKQDLLYTVIDIDPAGCAFSIPRAHTDAFVAADEPDRLLAAIAAPNTRIVSLTVTENGYTFHPSTGQLDFDNPKVRHDLEARDAPLTTIGRVVRGLQHRMVKSGDPITVLSCDNLSHNGRRVDKLISNFVESLPGAEGEDLAAWIAANVTFPSSMVDRIVPATADAHRHQISSALGYTDAIPVPAERFSMWVLEDRFAAGRPVWEDGGAIFTPDVEGYEQLKLRLLNGTHSLIAYLGALEGCVTIPDAVATSYIRSAAQTVLEDEYLPSVTLPTGVDPYDYEAQLFTRWQNTALGHKTSQVGSDGSVKLPQRVCAPALQLLDAGTMPHHLALTLAAYLCCIAPLTGFDPGPSAVAMHDAARSRLVALARRASDGVDLARRVFDQGRVFQDGLSERRDFVDRVGELINTIVKSGPRAAAEGARTASATSTCSDVTTLKSSQRERDEA